MQRLLIRHVDREEPVIDIDLETKCHHKPAPTRDIILKVHGITKRLAQVVEVVVEGLPAFYCVSRTIPEAIQEVGQVALQCQHLGTESKCKK